MCSASHHKIGTCTTNQGLITIGPDTNKSWSLFFPLSLCFKCTFTNTASSSPYSCHQTSQQLVVLQDESPVEAPSIFHAYRLNWTIGPDTH